MNDELYDHLLNVMYIMMVKDYDQNMEVVCRQLTEATELDENVLWRKFMEL